MKKLVYFLTILIVLASVLSCSKEDSTSSFSATLNGQPIKNERFEMNYIDITQSESDRKFYGKWYLISPVEFCLESSAPLHEGVNLAELLVPKEDIINISGTAILKTFKFLKYDTIYKFSHEEEYYIVISFNNFRFTYLGEETPYSQEYNGEYVINGDLAPRFSTFVGCTMTVLDDEPNF